MPTKESAPKRRKSREKREGRPALAVEATVDRTTREQYRFLDFCLSHSIELTVFTSSGATFIGVVYQHDRETILFGGRSQNAQKRLIRKGFISMMVPKEPIELFAEYRGLGTARSRKAQKRQQKS